MKKITASVVLYNTAQEEVLKCLALLLSSRHVSLVFVVDNSHVSTSAYQELDGVVYIHAPENLGYGPGHNFAIRHVQNRLSEYHLVMNTDVSFDPNIFNDLVKFMDNNSDIALSSPFVVNDDGEDGGCLKYSPSPIDLIVRMLPHYKFLKSFRDRLNLRYKSGVSVVFQPYISGCFMLFRKKILRSVGDFDDNFFMYPEDIDVTRRIWSVSQAVCLPELQIVHSHRAESKKSLKMLIIHAFNMVKYFNKWGWLKDAERKQLNSKCDKLNQIY
jgi:GT2 family glycosyltransferase